MSTTNYGVEFNKTIGAPELTRIGNMGLHHHEELPVHNQIRKCLLNDAGLVNYYLHPENDLLKEDGITPSALDGTDGQVMVEIPEHWVRWDTHGRLERIQVSHKPLLGYYRQRRLYVSAYEATVLRAGNILSSVINDTADYRGGNNNAAWDLEDRSLLGKPATAISLTNFRNYARNRGDKWNAYAYECHTVLYYLFLIEYATRHSQAAFNATPTSEGFRQGGMGPGVTTVVSAQWSAFNNQYPIVPCGKTAGIGVATGVVDHTIENWNEGSPTTVQVPSYRGIENPFGHLWKWTDGILFNVFADDEGGQSIIYVPDNDNFASSLTEDYKEIGLIPRANGYIREMQFSRKGGFMAKANTGASATTFWCDQFYTSVPASGASLRGMRVGGASNSGALAGFGCSRTYYAPSRTSASIGSRLCFLGED